jgi:hypothetical protein
MEHNKALRPGSQLSFINLLVVTVYSHGVFLMTMRLIKPFHSQHFLQKIPLHFIIGFFKIYLKQNATYFELSHGA